MDILVTLVMLGSVGLAVYLALDAVRQAKK